jgi:hypothetical protein
MLFANLAAFRTGTGHAPVIFVASHIDAQNFLVAVLVSKHNFVESKLCACRVQQDDTCAISAFRTLGVFALAGQL